jgi:hypothetical protein
MTDPLCRIVDLRTRIARLATVLLAVALSTAPGGSASAQDRIDELIRRLEQQDREIAALRKEVDELRQVTPPPPAHPEYRREDGEDTPTDYVNPDLRLDVAGQVNPAINVAGDGRSTKAYFVDNDSTASRIRFAGVGVFADGPRSARRSRSGSARTTRPTSARTASAPATSFRCAAPRSGPGTSASDASCSSGDWRGRTTRRSSTSRSSGVGGSRGTGHESRPPVGYSSRRCGR